jgi:hypothetical protein
MYFSYAPFCLFSVKKSLNHFEQSTVYYEPREYYDPSGALRFVSTTIQVVDLATCPSLPRFVLMNFFRLVLGPHFFFPNAAFAKNVHHNICERVRLVGTGLAAQY